MRRLRDQSGFTLPEVLTAIALFMFIFGATLGTFEGFVTRSGANTKLNDAQDQARTAIDRMARQLRNVASPTNVNIKSIDQATDDDLVFQTVDPVKRWVRYCLDLTNRASATLWMQTQTLPAQPPEASECPATGWEGTSQVVTGNVVNRRSGAGRPIFFYTGLGPDGDTAKITGIRAELFLDVNSATKSPAETSITSGDFLRNQNQPPDLLDFGMVQSPLGSRNFILNGSNASDPEGRTLDYLWYKGSGSTANLPSCDDDDTQSGGGFTCIGRGLTLNYVFPPSASGTIQTITLKVTDPGGLFAVKQQQTPVLP